MDNDTLLECMFNATVEGFEKAGRKADTLVQEYLHSLASDMVKVYIYNGNPERALLFGLQGAFEIGYALSCAVAQREKKGGSGQVDDDLNFLPFMPLAIDFLIDMMIVSLNKTSQATETDAPVLKGPENIWKGINLN